MSGFESIEMDRAVSHNCNYVALQCRSVQINIVHHVVIIWDNHGSIRNL